MHFDIATIPKERHLDLIAPVTDGTLEKISIERDWKAFSEYLEQTETLPSLDDYFGVWNVTKASLWMFSVPKSLTIWTAWTTAHVLNHLMVINSSYAKKNERWPREYTVARKGFLDIFATMWDEPLTPEEKLSVQEHMLKTEGRSTLLNWIPEQMLEVASEIDGIVGNWSVSKRSERKTINKTRNRFALLLNREHAIRAIPEFGQYT